MEMGSGEPAAEQEQSLPEQRGRTARRLANVDLLLEAISQLDQALQDGFTISPWLTFPEAPLYAKEAAKSRPEARPFEGPGSPSGRSQGS
jgi:hypothetical protein